MKSWSKSKWDSSSKVTEALIWRILNLYIEAQITSQVIKFFLLTARTFFNHIVPSSMESQG